MEKQKYVDFWYNSSKHDLDVAVSLFNSKHFDYCLFLCHLSLEKLLKAFWIKNNSENIPPKTHNLVYLAEQSHLTLDDDQLKFLQFVNSFNIGTRYPDYKLKIYKMCNEEFTERNFKKVKEFHTWLTRKL